MSSLIDDKEEESGDVDDVSSEKEFSPPDNRERPTNLNDISPKRILDVPYDQKDQAKAAGAWWAPRLKKWYVPRNMSIEHFKEWWTRDTRRAMGAAKGPRDVSTTARGGGGSSRHTERPR